jgi:hypothetical protein
MQKNTGMNMTPVTMNNFMGSTLPLLFFIFFRRNLCSLLKTFVCAIYTIVIEKQPTNLGGFILSLQYTLN